MTTSTARAAAARERGFTLIELLVVVIVIGALAAIAVPVYLNQRAKSYRAQAYQDARSIAAAYETWGVDNPGQTYPDICQWCNPAQLAAAPAQLDAMGIRLSPRTVIHAFDMAPYLPAAGLAPGQAYCIELRVPHNTGVFFYYSYTGGFRAGTCQSAHTP